MPSEYATTAGKRPLDFEPRTRFSYSSTGYKILGRIIEGLTIGPAFADSERAGRNGPVRNLCQGKNKS